MQPYKEDLKQAYNQLVEELEVKIQRGFHARTRHIADLFVKELPGKMVLDVGAGTGEHAKYFNEVGLDVVCVDISDEMLKKCESKGLKTLLVDLEELHFPDRTVDGIWAFSSIIHIKREQLPKVFHNFARMLKPRGILCMALKEGEKDGFELDQKTQIMRWFTYFLDAQVHGLVDPYFETIFHSTDTTETGRKYLNYVLRKR